MSTDRYANGSMRGGFSVTVRNAMVSLPLLLLAACGGGSNVALQAIAITPMNPSQRVGMTLLLVATGKYSDGSTRDVSSSAMWTSSTGSIATVSAVGLVSAVGIGTSVITATLDGVSGRAIMTATPGPTESILHQFGLTASDGQAPAGSLIQASDGNFYGTTSTGGANSCFGQPNSCGTVYKITAAGVETVLYSFGASPSDGATPVGSLIQASDGNFYGTTAEGGANSCLVGAPNSCGTVFKITPAGVETVLYSFGASASDAWGPTGPLIQASDGNLYGTTGGSGGRSCGLSFSSCGTVFKITPAGVETVLYAFGASASDGWGPTGSLVQASDGNFYGTTFTGGAYDCSNQPDQPNSCGTVYKITPAGVETVLYSFGASASDGWSPAGSLVQASDGNFYGTTSTGGANSCSSQPNSCGTVYKITPAGVETVLYSFGASPSDGATPVGSLIQASDGNFYGVTSKAGSLDTGTVYKLVP